MKGKNLKITAAVLIIVVSIGIFYWQVTAAKAEIVELWGMADAKEININSKVSGRVIELLVDEGDSVKEGQIIARIDSDYQEPQQRQAQAALAAQYAQLQQVMIASQSAEGTLDANLKAAEARLNQAKTAVNLAAKDETRYRQLLSEEAIAIQLYDTYKSKLDDTLAAQAAAEANVESARAALFQNAQNQAQINAAREQAAALQSQLDSVNINLEETEIKASFEGIITKKYVEEGQLISSTVPIYSLQDKNDNWVDFKVKETDINNFNIGDKIKLQGRNDNLMIDGTVESIRRKADFATQKATSERGDVDIMAFNVKIRTNDEKIYPGMRFKILRNEQ